MTRNIGNFDLRPQDIYIHIRRIIFSLRFCITQTIDLIGETSMKPNPDSVSLAGLEHTISN
jgi:hypothetical protein